MASVSGSGVSNGLDQDERRQLTFLDIVSADERLEVQRQTLRGDVLCRGGVEGAGDEPRDERQVHDVR